jgi:hypothetical protein
VFRITLELSEQRNAKTNGFGLAAGTYAETAASLAIRPRHRRNRRREGQVERARLVLLRLKSYLMATEVEVPGEAEAAAAH